MSGSFDLSDILLIKNLSRKLNSICKYIAKYIFQ
jgi:hypothetical protein